MFQTRCNQTLRVEIFNDIETPARSEFIPVRAINLNYRPVKLRRSTVLGKCFHISAIVRNLNTTAHVHHKKFASRTRKDIFGVFRLES